MKITHLFVLLYVLSLLVFRESSELLSGIKQPCSAMDVVQFTRLQLLMVIKKTGCVWGARRHTKGPVEM